MKISLVLALSFIASTHCLQDQFQGSSCTYGSDYGNIRLAPPSAGAIQICLNSQQFGVFWSYVNSEWSETAAQVSCRQLGFLNARAMPTNLTVENDHWTITTPPICNGNEYRLRQCWHGVRTLYGMEPVAGLICDCMEGEIRLVAGSTHMEGRIELCSNGRWGTVCGDGWTERKTARVCSKLGYSSENATAYYFGEGTGPVYNVTCLTTETDTSDCNLIITQSSCAHSMDVGVRCLPFTDACADLVNATSVTLGALIGLLAAALVVVVTGWIVSCFYFQRKINKKCKDHTDTTSASTSDPTLQLNNPAYDGSTTVPHTTYSSHGPSYEVIDTNEGVGHSYDVISRRGAPRAHPPTTHPVSNEEYSTLDTNRENEYHTLEINTGDGQYSMVGQTNPQNDGPADPQDYDVPAPPQGEEYSTLKHR